MRFITAIMLPSCGMKNEFITVDEVSEKCTGTSAGMTSSLTLATPCPDR